jgi:octaprenyl-diphosphate synthase
MTDLKQRILDRVQDDLADIETALRAHLDPYLDLVAQVAGHILFSGGKRLRPLMMVLGARLCGSRDPLLPTYATLFEYLHAATLVHDDVVDGALMRRGKPVAHTRWDSPTAVLTGDYLLARALKIATMTGRTKVIEVLSSVTEHMSQGEIQQLARKGQVDLSESEYLQIIRAKTAVLFEGAARVSALVADAPPEMEAALATYGYELGIAFQMVDDLLDYTQDSRTLGKQTGADLREGKLTLPVILTLQAADGPDRRRMTAIIQRPDFTAADFAQLVDLMTRYGGIDTTRRRARECVDRAKKALAGFPASEPHQVLLDVADYALLRTA